MWAREASALGSGVSAQALRLLCVSHGVRTPRGQIDTPPPSCRPCSGYSGPGIPQPHGLEPTFRDCTGSSPCSGVSLQDLGGQGSSWGGWVGGTALGLAAGWAVPTQGIGSGATRGGRGGRPGLGAGPEVPGSPRILNWNLAFQVHVEDICQGRRLQPFHLRFYLAL